MWSASPPKLIQEGVNGLSGLRFGVKHLSNPFSPSNSLVGVGLVVGVDTPS